MRSTEKIVESGETLITVLHHYFLDKEYEWCQAQVEELLNTAKFHGLSALLVQGVPAEYLQSRQIRNVQIAICRNDAIDYEYKEIIDFMEQQGIWHLPLKGIILKNYYPETWMREMADVDILYDTRHFSEVKQFMTERGYSVSVREGSNCDSYQMADMYHFEIHKRLFDPDTSWYDYFRKTPDRMILVEGKAYEYRLTKEDFYIYLLAHSLKHFAGAGTGLRNLIDIHFFLACEGENLNWEYLDQELSYVPDFHGIPFADYEAVMRGLNEKLFCNEWDNLQEVIRMLAPIEEKILYSFLTAGTYGSKEKELENLMKRYSGENPHTLWGKIRYLGRRLFPEMEWYKTNAPYCYEHPWAIPFFLTKRLLWGVCSLSRIWKEIKWTISR